MGVITKIRNKSGLLIIVIGVALVLFILSDFLNQGGSFNAADNVVGEIEGEAVTYVDFENLVAVRVEAVKQRSQQATLDQATIDQIREQVWNELLQERILLEEISEAGFGVSPEELVDMIQGPNPHPSVVQSFTNPNTGQFSANDVVRFIQNLDQDETGQSRAQWIQFENGLKKQRASEKYYNLIKKALYVTGAEAKENFNAKRKTMNLRYVGQKYALMTDSVSVSESDLKAYYDQHKNEAEYQQEETTRDIEYVSFNVDPSEEDRQNTENYLAGIKAEFEKTTKDTLFIATNSDNKNGIGYFSKVNIDPSVDSLIENSEVGQVVGPFFDYTTNSFKLVKNIGEKFAPDSVKASHILIKIQNGDSAAAQAKVDSLVNLIKGGADFAQLATNNSEDLGSAQDGGNLDWFTEGRMVRPFNDACFEGKVGDMPVVESQFGIHIIKITDQTKSKKKLLLATVDRELLPGKKTYELAYNSASTFSINNNTAEKFKEAGNALGIKMANDITESAKYVPGLENPRKLIMWMYKADKGSVSEPFELGNKFVVARLTNIKDEGQLSFDAVKDILEEKVINEKKAEIIKGKMAGNNDLNSLASTLGTNIETAPNVQFSTAIPGMGGEKEILGKVFGMNKGDISEPLVGKFGTYVIAVDEVVEAPVADYSGEVDFLNRNLTSRVEREVYEALKEVKNVSDNRAKFY
ncbi:MAG: peptidylprolyl isomerase [Flavobacteriales bacterium]|nr:peptidylprolyl isomerase [Flavobacteriales bacterium]